MIPIRDENPTRTFPFVTIAIIAMNAFVFIYELRLGALLEEKILLFAVTPYSITHMVSPTVLVTLITSLFFHGGFAHIFGNMLYLWVFGNNVEDRLGHIRFTFFYFVCGIMAALGQIVVSPNSKLPMIGASGAVSGVLGAYFLLYPRAKVLVLLPLFYIWRIVKIEAFWLLLFWMALQFLYGFVSFAVMDALEKGQVAWFAHIFGFLSGMIFLGLLLKKNSKQTKGILDD